MENQKIRWGIISTAKIAVNQLIPAILNSDDCELVAIASPSQEKAKTIVKQFQIPQLFSSYEEMFASEEIDAVYNPLPNHLHVPVSLQAIQHGKHVLCEKPAALNAQELIDLKKHLNSLCFMEAFMVRFHPQWHQVLELFKNGDLGEIRALQAIFCYHNIDSQNIRNKYPNGGGGLYDIGCYPITLSRFILKRNPIRVIAIADIDSEFGIDRTFSGILDYGQGQHLNFTVSTQAALTQSFRILGSKNRLDVQIPYNAPNEKDCFLYLDDGSVLDGSKIKAVKIAGVNQYQKMVEAFNRVIRKEEKTIYGIDDAIIHLKIIDALFESAKQNQWVNIDY